jgi:hypothetical protein
MLTDATGKFKTCHMKLSTIAVNNLHYLVIVNYLILYYKNTIASCANIEQPRKGHSDLNFLLSLQDEHPETLGACIRDRINQLNTKG